MPCAALALQLPPLGCWQQARRAGQNAVPQLHRVELPLSRFPCSLLHVCALPAVAAAALRVVVPSRALQELKALNGGQESKSRGKIRMVTN